MNTNELFEQMSNILIQEIFIKDAFCNFKQDKEIELNKRQKLYNIEV